MGPYKRHAFTCWSGTKVAFTLALTFTLSACGDTTPDSGGAPGSSYETPLPSLNPAAPDSNTISELESYASRTYPDHYAGLSMNDDGSVSVYRRDLPQLDADIRERFKPLAVQFFPAAHSKKELKEVAATITADIAYWRTRGIEINVVSVPHDGSRVRIGTADPSAADPLRTRYGPDLVEVTGEGIVPL